MDGEEKKSAKDILDESIDSVKAAKMQETENPIKEEKDESSQEELLRLIKELKSEISDIKKANEADDLDDDVDDDDDVGEDDDDRDDGIDDEESDTNNDDDENLDNDKDDYAIDNDENEKNEDSGDKDTEECDTNNVDNLDSGKDNVNIGNESSDSNVESSGKSSSVDFIKKDDKSIDESPIKNKILSASKKCLQILFFTFFGLAHLFLLSSSLLLFTSTINHNFSGWWAAFAGVSLVASIIYAYFLDYKKYDKYKATMYTAYTGFICFIVSCIICVLGDPTGPSLSTIQIYIIVTILWILLTIFYRYKIEGIKAILLSLLSGFTLFIIGTIIYTTPFVIPQGISLLAICAFALCRIVAAAIDYRKSALPRAIFYSHIMLFMLIFDIIIIFPLLNPEDSTSNQWSWNLGIVFVIPLLIASIICCTKRDRIMANICYIFIGCVLFGIGEATFAIISNWGSILSILVKVGKIVGVCLIIWIIIRIIFALYKIQYTCSRCGSEWALELVDEDIQDGYTKTIKDSNNKYKTYRIQHVKQVWRCKKCGHTQIKDKTRKVEI